MEGEAVLVRALELARRHQREVGWSDRDAATAAWDAVLGAERVLAAHRGEQYTEVLDLGVHWSAGAPIPHVVSDGTTAFVICRVGQPDPNWDGTSIKVVTPNDDADDAWAIIRFQGCSSFRIGAPNDEALHGHPLHGRGLRGYDPHEVHNSAWLEEHIRINAVHPHHSEEAWRQRRHYLLAFHDEMVEALARSIDAALVHGTLRSLLVQCANDLIDSHPRA